jgi:hypothetical protein
MIMPPQIKIKKPSSHAGDERLCLRGATPVLLSGRWKGLTAAVTGKPGHYYLIS